jgi:hypothetical protein
LNEGLFFRIFLVLHSQVASDGEAMDDTTVKVDLVGLLGFDQNFFRLVTLLGGEDLVGLGGRDGERSFDSSELVFLNESAQMMLV